MKKLYIILSLLGTVLSLGKTSAQAHYAELETIEIGTLSTTHVIFTSDLSYVDISMKDVIAAKVVDASKNMLALKAREPFDYVTTISALEANGTMHTFKVKYSPYPVKLVVDTRPGSENKGENTPINTQIRPGENNSQRPSQVQAPQGGNGGRQPRSSYANKYKGSGIISSGTALNVTTSETSNFGKADAPTLEEIMNLPQAIYHIGDKNFAVEAYCTNIYVYSDLIYVVLTIYNKSDIGFEAGDAQFTIENISKKQKNLATDKSVWAKSTYGSLSCAPQGRTMVGYSIPKFTLLKNECLKIYIYEKKGTRNLILTLTDKDINYAVSPK